MLAFSYLIMAASYKIEQFIAEFLWGDKLFQCIRFTFTGKSRLFHLTYITNVSIETKFEPKSYDNALILTGGLDQL